MQYYCYLLQSTSHPNYTYIGITKDTNKRLKQHNKQLKGGAKATRKFKDWNYVLYVQLNNKSSALRFEWFWTHNQNTKNKWIKTKSGLNNKLNRLNSIVKQFQDIIIYNAKGEIIG